MEVDKKGHESIFERTHLPRRLCDILPTNKLSFPGESRMHQEKFPLKGCQLLDATRNRNSDPDGITPNFPWPKMDYTIFNAHVTITIPDIHCLTLYTGSVLLASRRRLMDSIPPPLKLVPGAASGTQSPLDPALQSVKKTSGKQPKWTDLNVLGAGQPTTRLPQASIHEPKQKRSEWCAQLKKEIDLCGARLRCIHPTLNLPCEMETWNDRSGCTVAQFGQFGISACRKYHADMEVVWATKVTGNYSEEYYKSCATDLYNGITGLLIIMTSYATQATLSILSFYIPTRTSVCMMRPIWAKAIADL